MTDPVPTPAPGPGSTRRRLWLYVLTIIASALACLALLLLLQNIHQRKQEAREVVFRVVPIDEQTVDPERWGMNFPR
jgi:nitrite reductase (cytochrome c-552)